MTLYEKGLYLIVKSEKENVNHSIKTLFNNGVKKMTIATLSILSLGLIGVFSSFLFITLEN